MNPFKTWLGINCNDVPDHFMLLGLSRDETDSDTIKSAAKLQLKKLKKHENGPHAALASSTAKRVRKAFRVISNPESRQEYVELLTKRNAGRSTIDDAVVVAEPIDEIVVPIWSEQTAVPTAPTATPNAQTGTLLLIVGLVATGFMLILGLLGVGYWLLFMESDNQSDSVAVVAPADEVEQPEPQSRPQPEPEPKEIVDVKPAEAANSEPSKMAADVVESGVAESKPGKPEVSEKSEEPTENKTVKNDTEEVEVRSQSKSELTSVANLAVRAKAILKTNCFSCHGEAGKEEGGFGAALDRAKLVSEGHVVPGSPDESALLERMIEEDSPMPPAGEEPRPSKEDIEIVRQWILAGAKPFDEVKSTQFVSRSKRLESIASDLKSLSKRSRIFARYFSLTHLANAGDSTEKIETARQAIAKLFNSLSRNRKLANLTPIEDLPSVFRVDLRDVAWSDSQWNTMLLDYPYGVITESKDLEFLQESTGCELPVVRGDWFVKSASRPPLYHDLLEIPTTDRELEKQLQVNVVRNIRQERVFRIGFARSGVSQNNRLIERHESAFGAYWKSYDFAGNIEQQNLFEHPLGPDGSSDSFRHDGGEIIFQLPNGMLGYMLTDANGNRIDRGPTNIVSDPRQPDRAVINGVSCMSCHYGGFIPKDDEVRKHVAANKTAYSDFEKIMALYLTAEETDPKLESDTNKYLKALASSSINISNVTRSGEPVVLVSTRFSNEIDVVMAAAELGIELPAFEKLLDEATDEELIRQIGVLQTGGVVKRETFDDLFARMIRDFKIGSPTRISTSAIAIRRLRIRKSASQISVPERLNIIANRHFQLGMSLLEKKQWAGATANFERAIQIATDTEDRNTVLQHLIPLYERQSSAKNMIDAHAKLMDSVSGPKTSERAHDQFYHSVIRFILRKQVSKNQWSHKSSNAKTLREMTPIGTPLAMMHEVQIPTTVSSLIKRTFEKSLSENPNHEPTLLILHTHYEYLAKNEAKSNTILLRLKKIRERQGVPASASDNIQLARSYMSTGDFRKAAKLYQQLNATSSRSFSMLRNESSAHEKLGDIDQATVVLKEAWQMYLLNPPTQSRSYTLRLLAGSFLRLNDPDMAITVLKRANEEDNDASDRKDIRKKLARAYSLSKTVDRNAPEVKELLDPLRQFREEAAELEGKRTHSTRGRCQNLVKAAQAWIQAKENAKALATIQQASDLLPNVESDSAVERLHEDIGKIFRDLGDNSKALVHFRSFIELQDSNYSIEKGQKLILTLLEGENALEQNNEIKSLIDPLLKHRVVAKNLEKKLPYNESDAARNLVTATDLWVKAKENAEVKRCGKLAEKAIKKVAADYYGLPRFHHDLAKSYATSKLFEESIEQYGLAIKRAKNDREAKRYHHELEQMCQQNELTAPTLDSASQQRLDPLNKYRELAKGFEDSARRLPETAVDNLIKALENWLKAGEKEEATQVADKAGTLLQAAHRNGKFVDSCCRLASLLTHMKDADAAKKYYGLASESNPTSSQKAKIEKGLSELNGVNAK